MARYPDPEITPDSALVIRAKGDRLIIAVRYEASDGISAITVRTAQSSASRDPGIPDQVSANIALPARIAAYPEVAAPVCSIA
jgi:hypothetical protein